MRTVKIALQQAQPRLASSDPLRFAARAGRTARGLFPCAATSTLAGRARAGETTALSPAPCARTGCCAGRSWPAPRHSLTLVRAVGEQAKRTLVYHHLSAGAQVGGRCATTRYTRFICQRPCPAAAGGSSRRPIRSAFSHRVAPLAVGGVSPIRAGRPPEAGVSR